MPKPSAKTIVILAAICFMLLALFQVIWLRSAYEGEKSLYAKQRKQFESELQSRLKNDSGFKTEIKNILDTYNSGRGITLSAKTWFTNVLQKAILQIQAQKTIDAGIENFGISSHAHKDTSNNHLKPVIVQNPSNLTDAQMKKAAELCLHCILGLESSGEKPYDFNIFLVYRGERFEIYKRLGLLIIGSFILLLLLGVLFTLMLRKYRIEKSLAEAKNDFINNMSHEIQTPVFAIQMANKILSEKTTANEDLQKLTTIIKKETQQLRLHARKILELASLENEQVQLQQQRIDLNQFIREKEDTLELMLLSKNGKLTVYYSDKPVFGIIDPVYFHNVIISLVENAIKYNNNPPEVQITIDEKDTKIILSITDNGIGIDKRYLPYIGDKFYRVPEVRKNGSTGFGLGLSYVKQIIRLHKGNLNIRSELGKGTAIEIIIPKMQEHA